MPAPHYSGNRHAKQPDGTGSVRNEVGKDISVLIADTEIPVTSVSWDIEQETATSDFNDQYRQFTGGTAIHATGTIEIDGSNQEALRSSLINDEGLTIELNHVSIDIVTTQDRIVFQGVVFNNLSGEAPADDKTSRTVDWEADSVRFRRR
jgi:hypothetical protein